ncbi:MAG: hypothetical protein ABFC67_15210 [Mizugakiibacter sp.]|uniref:COG3904 family protein n=1 Tax=Mizugakiibacter sp. TaxID=1972610 RepID=UPI0031C7E2FC|nr:hypothetical protein [Xanthomonadaceae bacterium]
MLFKLSRLLGASFVFTLIVTTPSASAAALLDPPSTPMTFSLAANGGNCDDCEWIAAEGVITSSTPIDFENVLQKMHAPKVIALNSSGGDLVAGIKLGLVLRKHGFTTYVAHTSPTGDKESSSFSDTGPGICASSCAYAFLGGISRHVLDGSRFGVHQFRPAMTFDSEPSTDVMSSSQVIVAMLYAYTSMMGVDPKIIGFASTVSPDAILWLGKSELSALNVDTSKPAAGKWSLMPSSHGDGLAAFLDQRQPDTIVNAHIEIMCFKDPGSVLIYVEAPVDVKRNITDSIKSISISQPLISHPMPGLQNLLKNLEERSVVVHTFKAKVVNSKLRIIFAVRGDELWSYMNRNGWFSVDVDLPRYMWSSVLPSGVSSYRFPAMNDSSIRRLLERNCINWRTN